MICKWCGATVDVAKGKCPTCGKDIPPISDCGGFYNVVPKATRTPEQNHPIEQPPVQPYTPKESAAPMINESPKAHGKNHSNILLIVGVVVLAVAWIISFVQTGMLNKRMTGLESANVQNSDAIGDLTRSIESVSSRLSSVESQLEEQESQLPEEPKPEPQLEEQSLSFFVFADSDGMHAVNTSIAVKISFDRDSGIATCSFDGARLWEARLYEEDGGMPSTASPKAYEFYYDIADDILGSYTASSFTWRYRIPGASKWETIAEDEDGISIENSRSESTSKIILSSEWLEEHVPDSEMEIECVVERDSELGGTVKIEFGKFVGDTTNPIPEQD